MDECQHDWRVHPYKVTSRTLVFLTCIKCEKETNAPFHFQPKVNRRMEPATWKRYTGDTTEL